MSDLQIKGEVVVTSEKAESAFDRVAGKASRMATDVAGAAGKAGQAVDGIGAGAEKGAERFNRAESRMRDSIMRSTQQLQMLGKTASEKLEFNISAKGLDASKFEPYLAKLREAEAQTHAIDVATGNWHSSLARIGPMMAAAFSGAAMIGFGTKLVSVQREFDVLNSSLKTVTGSGAAAEREMAWLKDFAKETPFGLAQATQGFVKMKALGLDPTRAALTSFGNTASAMGKGLNQMIEAVADASTSEFERLKEFGIKAKKEGDNVSLTFQGVTTTIRNNAAEITSYLEKIGNVQFGGAMAERAKTLDGAIAGLGDTWDELFRTVNERNAGTLIHDSVKLATGAIEDATTIVRAMTSAANDSAAAAGAMSSVQNGIATVFETTAVLGANLSYVLQGVGREIGGLAAQVAQAAQFNFSGVHAIREQMVADAVAARREIDATTERILNARKAQEEYARWATRNASAATDPRRLDLGGSAAPRESGGTRKEVDAITKAYDQLVKKLGVDLVQAAAEAEGAQHAYNKSQTEFLAVAGSAQWAQWSDKQRSAVAGLYEQKIAQEQVTAAAKADADVIASANKALSDLYAKSEQMADSTRAQVVAAKAENELIGLTGPALWDLREARMMEAAAQYEQRAAAIAGIPGREAEAQNLRETAKEIRNLAAERKRGAAAQAAAQTSSDALKELDAYLDPSRAQDFGAALRDAFGDAGNSLAKLTNAMQEYGRKEAEIAKQRGNLSFIKDEEERIKKTGQLNRMSAQADLSNYAALTGAAKGFFSEHSRGYEAMAAAEQAFRIAEMAMALQSGFVKAKEAIVSQASGGDPYTAFARMAAMAAAMATLGFAVSGAGGGSSSAVREERQRTQGTGTVFGDSSAKSGSIGNAFDMLEDSAKMELRYQSGMLASLRNIEDSMSGVANAVLRTVGIASGNGVGVYEGVLSTNKGDPIMNALGMGGLDMHSKLPLIGGVIGKLQSLWGKTKQEITDSGLVINGMVADLAAGFGFGQYSDVKTTKSSFFGLSKSTKTKTIFGDLDGDTNAALGRVFAGLSGALQSAAGAFGLEAEAVGQQIAKTIIDIPRTSLRDLKGDELTDAISSVISAAADKMAEGVIPGLIDFQKVGEGYFETIVRVSAGIESADYALERFGITAVGYASIASKQGDVAAEIFRDSVSKFEGAGTGMAQIIRGISGSVDDLADTYKGLITARNSLKSVGARGSDPTFDLLRGAGGLDALQDGLDNYLKGYFSETEQFTAASARLSEQFAQMGIRQPPSIEAFRALASGLDLTDAASAQLFGKLMTVAEAFYDVANAVEESKRALKEAFDEVAGDWLEGEALRTYRATRISENLGEVGLGISPETILGASVEQYKAMYYAIDQTTMAGREQAKALLELWGAYKDMNSAAEEAAKEAETAAERLKSAWQSVGDSLVAEIKRIRGEIAGQGPMGLSYAQSQFAIATAQARAGDQTAALSLPELSRTVLDLAKQNATSALELKSFQAQIAASLQETMAGIGKSFGITVPSLAVGTTYVPGDTLAQLHKGEAVIPAAFNPFANGAAKSDDGKLVALLTQLVDDNRVQASEIARLNLRIARATESTVRVLDDVTDGGDVLKTKEVI